MTSTQSRSARARGTPESRLRKKAQAMSKLALQTLGELMDARSAAPAPIRLAAAREVLDRGHGRPRLGNAEPTPPGAGMTVIVKRYSDVTEEELARSDEGEP